MTTQLGAAERYLSFLLGEEEYGIPLLTVREVIARHSSRTYRSYMSGFVPGFAYLGDLDESLVLARRTVPRPDLA